MDLLMITQIKKLIKKRDAECRLKNQAQDIMGFNLFKV
jgi:hypothetical protein